MSDGWFITPFWDIILIVVLPVMFSLGVAYIMTEWEEIKAWRNRHRFEWLGEFLFFSYTGLFACYWPKKYEAMIKKYDFLFEKG